MIEHWSAGWGAGVIGLLLASLLILALFLYKFRQNDEKRLHQGIGRFSVESISDAVIPDGIDGYLFADYLFRMEGQIIVLNFEPRKGYVFGAPNIDEWTSVENNRTEKFMNPLKRTSLFVHHCNHIIGSECVRGYVLFGSSSEFPKGVPDGVIEMTRFETTLGLLSDTVDDGQNIDLAWEALKQANLDSEAEINSNL